MTEQLSKGPFHYDDGMPCHAPLWKDTGNCERHQPIPSMFIILEEIREYISEEETDVCMCVGCRSANILAALIEKNIDSKTILPAISGRKRLPRQHENIAFEYYEAAQNESQETIAKMWVACKPI